MPVKFFGDKRIKIRKISKGDLRKVKEFQDFINSLIEEEAEIRENKKFSLKEEKKWLEDSFKKVRGRKKVFLVAECEKQIVGTCGIELDRGRLGHIGNLGITIRKGYRGMGLGKYIMGEIIKLAKKELKPKPKIIRLSVLAINKPAIGLYQKYGFKKVASVPKQIQYKGKLIDEVIMLLYL